MVRVRTFVMPSTVGLGAATESGVGLAGVVKLPSRGRRPHHVIVEGEEYLVGPGVSDFSRPIHRMDFDRFTDSPELRASLYAALARRTGQRRKPAGPGHRAAGRGAAGQK